MVYEIMLSKVKELGVIRLGAPYVFRLDGGRRFLQLALLGIVWLCYLASGGNLSRAQSVRLLDKVDCTKTTQAQVEGALPFNSDSEYRSTRRHLLDQLLVQAAEQVNGVELLSRTISTIESTQGSIDSDISELSVSKIKGFVKTYSFPQDGEKVTHQGESKVLHLKVNVAVCDQRGVSKTFYVKIGQIVPHPRQNVSEHELQRLVASGKPRSSRIAVVQDTGDETYYDFVITGFVRNVSATHEFDPLRTLIGNIVRTESGKPIVEPDITRISSTIFLRADDGFDSTRVEVVKTFEEKLPADISDAALSQRLSEFSKNAVAVTSERLFDKLARELNNGARGSAYKEIGSDDSKTLP